MGIQQFHTVIKRLAAGVFVSCFGLMILSPLLTAHAAALPPIPATSCDTLYYEGLAARGWMEAQREITQNQNIILKPDSVMEYTCFDKFVNVLAQRASSMLSETDDFGDPVANDSMDSALEQLVGVSLRAYGTGNFGQSTYNLLGGHAAGSGLSHVFGSISGGSYSCNIMARVWQAAKCINFGSNGAYAGVPTDGFYTFAEYADTSSPSNAYDKRYRPTACTAPKTTWNANLTTAYITPPWTLDPVNTYLATMSAPACGASPCLCSTGPIPTGLKINRTGSEAPTTYDDKVCLQPGCRYNPPGGKVNGSAQPEGCYAR